MPRGRHKTQKFTIITNDDSLEPPELLNMISPRVQLQQLNYTMTENQQPGPQFI
jgi:hypothetical protein